jgi:hypothetical protein
MDIPTDRWCGLMMIGDDENDVDDDNDDDNVKTFFRSLTDDDGRRARGEMQMVSIRHIERHGFNSRFLRTVGLESRRRWLEKMPPRQELFPVFQFGTAAKVLYCSKKKQLTCSTDAKSWSHTRLTKSANC